VLVGLFGFSVESFYSRLGNEVASAMHGLRSAHLSRLDNAKLERGYYEGLLDVGRFNSQLWEVYAKKPTNWLAADFTGLKQFTGNFAQQELKPSSVSVSQYGALTTNRLGMRDKDYTDARPADTWRVAVLGPSNVMGWGVPDGATFEALLEERLNREPLGAGHRRFELLNYGVPGYQPPQQLVNFERAMRLQPNVLFYVATGRELRRSALYMAEVLNKGIDIPYPELQAIVERAGARVGMDETAALRLLEPHGSALLAAVYQRIAAHAREAGVRVVWVFLPQVRSGSWQEETPEAVRLATEAGFTVVSLDGIYDGIGIEQLRLSEWDDHPNAQAHRLIADRLYQELSTRAGSVFAPVSR
jgi:hypothetical protein